MAWENTRSSLLVRRFVSICSVSAIESADVYVCAPSSFHPAITFIQQQLHSAKFARLRIFQSSSLTVSSTFACNYPWPWIPSISITLNPDSALNSGRDNGFQSSLYRLIDPRKCKMLLSKTGKSLAYFSLVIFVRIAIGMDSQSSLDASFPQPTSSSVINTFSPFWTERRRVLSILEFRCCFAPTSYCPLHRLRLPSSPLYLCLHIGSSIYTTCIRRIKVSPRTYMVLRRILTTGDLSVS
ncbi:hypothetical protein BJ170DRAFT_366505 [Xylariales sp. AK1849]|nr:hypothetical protein BJ170DRAFT_366505 [Xylariales sp. AK1849]